MLTCGLKLTHDSTIAVFEQHKLLMSIELEKIDNNNRYKIIDALENISSILKENGIQYSDIGRWVVDGWIGLNDSKIVSQRLNKKVELKVAPYHEIDLSKNILERNVFYGVLIEDQPIQYESYSHVGGHVLAAYYTSPFHKRNENSLILVWDGGMHPRIYGYDTKKRSIVNHGAIFSLGVNIYSIFSQYFRPFKINENVIKDELSIAGKVMAYIAYGKVDEQILLDLQRAYELTAKAAEDLNLIPSYPHLFAKAFTSISKGKSYKDENVLTSFHFFLGDLLLNKLKQFEGENICISGGAALNIKWNSSIRNSKLFKDVWVPPFPNDSGSAIGAGLCSLHYHNIVNDECHFSWDIYSGPKLKKSNIPNGWTEMPFTIKMLARLLAETDEPILFINGNSELGPRALGNRSILCSPHTLGNKDRLNYLKMREYYRPVAPICLEEYGPDIFDPGSPDPYMLFEHRVRENWREKIPVVTHFDNTARLQTIDKTSNPIMYLLLHEFYLITGTPLLCNTSANFKGCGFFPDLASAMDWGQIKYVWSEGILYYKI
jgi:carbamoyltransferase